MSLKKLLIISSLVFSSCAKVGISPVRGYLCIYDRPMDTAYCQNLNNRSDEKAIKGPALDGFYMFDTATFADLQRFKHEAEQKIKQCGL